MSDGEEFNPEFQQPESGQLDNPLRAVIVTQSPTTEGEMEERMLDSIVDFDQMNGFFDKFDEKIAIPNEGKLKYDVGSDGLVVFIVETHDLRDKVLAFIDEYNGEFDEEKEEEKEEDTQNSKKRKV